MLSTETEASRIVLAKAMSDLHLVMDYTGYSRPVVYALPNKKHHIVYDDGDKKYHNLNEDSKEMWKFTSFPPNMQL
jgi:hypothetical protein